MQNGLFCSCNFYNLKYLDIINWSFGINGSLFYFLRKSRKINKGLVKKKTKTLTISQMLAIISKTDSLKNIKLDQKNLYV